MEKVKFADREVTLAGQLPEKGTRADDFTLTGESLNNIRLADFIGKRVILNIFPSLDTEVCAASVRRFNEEAASLPDTVVLNVSMDLPFAATRFCTVNGIKNALSASGFRSDFGKTYGVEMIDGPLAGLYTRAVIIIDATGQITYTQLVPDITHEPDYAAALASINNTAKSCCKRKCKRPQS